MKDLLPGEKLADMLCLVRLHAELRYLESSLGPTTVRALLPVFNLSSQDPWQVCRLRGER